MRSARTVALVTGFRQAAVGIWERVPPTIHDAARPSGPAEKAARAAPDARRAGVVADRAGAGAPEADEGAPVVPGGRGGVGGVGAELRRMLAADELHLPLPGAGRTADRWAALAAWGGRDLSLARLAEGHVDAVAILAEARREPVPGALYGVWASRAGGAAVQLERRGGAGVLRGTMRFCSGARVLDRALVVVDPPPEAPSGRLLLDIDVRGAGVAPVPGTWCTAAMAGADTLDVAFDGAGVGGLDGGVDAVGEPGWYVARPGFAVGGAGVAAVWWGGAAGVLDRVLRQFSRAPDRHALAHVGELHAALAATQALLRHTAALVDAAFAGARVGSAGTAGATAAGSGVRADDDPAAATSTHTAAGPGPDVVLAVATLRAAVERAVRDVVDRAPRIVGPGPLSRDAALAGALADLTLYVRQHHAERDHAALGEQVVDRWHSA